MTVPVKSRFKVTFFDLSEDGSIKDRCYVFVDDFSPEEAVELACYLMKIDRKDKAIAVESAKQ